MIKKNIQKILNKFGYKITKLKTNLDLENIEKEIREISTKEKEFIKICSKYSMTPKLRLWNVINSYKHIYNNKIEGDFVECGVWKGGNLILIQKMNELFNNNMKIYGYDTFEGMSKPDSPKDGQTEKKIYENYVNKNEKWCFCSQEEVKQNFKQNTYENNNLFLIKGKVEDSLLNKNNLPDKISILRLDTDWYKSTKIELDILFPKLLNGGILIIDDYGNWKGSKLATDEYFTKKNLTLHYVDRGCRFLIKS